MKIKGFFRADNNAPYVAATLVQSELQLDKDVWFLVDSGASATIIADKDALGLGIDYSSLQKLQEGMTGIGGTVETFVLPSVKLVFSTDDGSYEGRHGANIRFKASSNFLDTESKNREDSELAWQRFLEQIRCFIEAL